MHLITKLLLFSCNRYVNYNFTCFYRDKLISSQSGPQEYRFNGRSHIIMPGRGYLGSQKNQVLLFFRTYAPDGLIYLVGDNKHFFSIQMQDGHVYLQVSYCK